MKLLHRFSASVLILLLSPMAANAVPITIGSLSSNDDGSTNVITDTLNNLEWLRWDEARDLTYAQTAQEIATGGAYEGFRIANVNDSQLFVTALLSDVVHTDCTMTSAGEKRCGTNPLLATDLHVLLGSSFTTSSNLAWFLSDNTTNPAVGYVRVYGGTGAVNVNNEGDVSISEADRFSNVNYAIPWLMSRQASPAAVPEPGTLALLGLGMAGLGMTRRKKIG